ncbi:GAF domain-containing protein [Streptomyces sp. IB2014 016-6]|uniref:GAF domain-containing protein n=1 Tax=Streptomyces sp. IB2014 016-6 TaxID=2517818 RepID=UPI0011C9838C|nr:GAF domain-containing protein [Streptomyces sp. IB2014 016-6]TXL87494.1 GAF domain-containing protein [Streptomyces sp. IB2014 016-6]
MRYDPIGRLLLTPVDRDAPDRVRRLRLLGIGERPEPAFDGFALHLAQLAGTPYAMVNFIAEERQFYAGLHAPAPGTERSRDRDHGYCPHVVVRRKALVLEDVRDFPRFAGNAVVDETGLRSYLGVPLIDRTGIALGTVCVADTRPRHWGRAGLETVKSLAAELSERIRRREDGGSPHPG